MYGKTRYLYQNLITAASMLTPDSQATGFLCGTEKIQGEGIAILRSGGSFSGSDNLRYTVQIDSVSAGNDVGQATFHWKTSDTAAGTWEATGVTTSTSLITLSSGVKVVWIAGDGTSNDCELLDTWIFDAEAIYSPANLIDLNRHTWFRSDSTYNIVVDLGSAQQIEAFLLLDHNLTSGGSATLQGNTADSWSSPAYSQALTVADPLLYYLDQTYRYWRLVVTDATISYFEAAGLYLGDYLELSRNAQWDTPRNYGAIITGEVSQTGVQRRKIHAEQAKLTLSYPQTLLNADVNSLIAMREALLHADTGVVDPVFVNLFNDETDTTWLMDWQNIDNFARNYFRYMLNSASLELTEVVQTRV